MTPDVFVEFLKDSDIDVIAITDHNSSMNVESFSRSLSELGILVVPGIEITSREEVHVLGYFQDLESALEVSRIVRSHLPDVEFDPERVGYQLLVNERGEYTGFEEKPLFMATDLSVDEVVDLIRSVGGISVLAHVDRVFGIEFQLGFIPDLDVEIIEVRRRETHVRLSGEYRILTSSDAHTPEEIGSRFSVLHGDDPVSSLREGNFKNMWEI